MSTNILETLDISQNELLHQFIDELKLDLNDFFSANNVSGHLESLCYPPSGRPMQTIWKDFNLVTVINAQNDWTIFGNVRDNRGNQFSFVIDLLESTDKFEIRIGNFYPWRCKLSDTDSVSYRAVNNKIIIRAIKIVSSGPSYCHIIGIIAAENSTLATGVELGS